MHLVTITGIENAHQTLGYWTYKSYRLNHTYIFSEKIEYGSKLKMFFFLKLLLFRERSIAKNPNVHLSNYPSRHLIPYVHKSRIVSFVGTCVRVKRCILLCTCMLQWRQNDDEFCEALTLCKLLLLVCLSSWCSGMWWL